MKRILLASAVLLLNSAGFAGVIAEKEFTLNGIRFTDHGETVAGLESVETAKVVIPSIVEYKGGQTTVQYIAIDAFRNCTGLQSLTIPGSVETFTYDGFVGETFENPFSGSPSLRELIFEEGENTINLPYPFVESGWNLESLVINRPFRSNVIVNDGDGKYHWEDKPVFEGLKAEKVALQCEMEYLPDEVFRKSAIDTLMVGEGIGSLGVKTFTDMQRSIKTVIFEDGVQELKLYRTVVSSSDSGGIGMIWTTKYPSFDESAVSALDYV